MDENAMPHKLGCETLWAYNATGIAAAGTSLGVGGQMEEIVAAAEVHGISMSANDEVYWMVDAQEFGAVADLSKDLVAQVLFCSQDTDLDSIQWKASVTGNALGILIPDASASADGAITFTAQTMISTAAVSCKTAPISFDTEDKGFENDEFLMFSVELEATATDADQTILIALRLFYTRQLFHASGRAQRT